MTRWPHTGQRVCKPRSWLWRTIGSRSSTRTDAELPLGVRRMLVGLGEIGSELDRYSVAVSQGVCITQSYLCQHFDQAVLLHPRFVVVRAEHERGLVEDSTWDQVDADAQLGGIESQSFPRQSPRAVQQNVEAPRVERRSDEARPRIRVEPHPPGEQALTGLNSALKHSRHCASLA